MSSNDLDNSGSPFVWHKGQDITDFITARTDRQSADNTSFRMAIDALKSETITAGGILSGKISVGDDVVIIPSAMRTRIKAIKSAGADIAQAKAGETVEIEFSDNIGVAVGEMICTANDPVEAADQFETTICWLSSEPMMAGRPYLFKTPASALDGSVTAIKYSFNTDSTQHIAASSLQKAQMGVCNISLSDNIPFEPFDNGRKTSQFEIYDKESGKHLAIGIINFALRRASNVHWQALDVTRETRARLKGQKPAILWFTGLSGSGKSAIANIVEKKLTAMGRHTYTLDGDNIRHGLNRDLGFTDVDRVENIRRIAEVSKLMADSGLITLVSFISPFRAERQLARELAQEGEFIEIHVDTPLKIAEARDIKGLYKKARAGEISNFTGIDSPYEPPLNPEIRVDTVKQTAEEAAELVLDKLRLWGMIDTQ